MTATPNTPACAQPTSLSSSPTCRGRSWPRCQKRMRRRWTCLFRNLNLKAGQTLVIRGATSCVGPGRTQDGRRHGCATSLPRRAASKRFRHAGEARRRRASSWRRPDLAAHIAESKQIDAVLDLVGNSTILDSLDMLRRGGTACLAGWLGGLAPIGDFNPLAAHGQRRELAASSPVLVFGNPGFEVSDIPLSDIAQQIADGKLDAKPARVFSFDQIREAHRVTESGEAGGKIVVVMD